MLYLASASPRRQELLRQVGLGFEVLPSTVDETRAEGEAPAHYVQRVADDKALWVAERIRHQGLPVWPVLAADTAVELGGEIFGKPRDRVHAAEMLRRLSGRTHSVFTALCLLQSNHCHRALSESRVTFASLGESDIAHYLACGEADDKAGAYAVQGRAAGFIVRLEGSYSGVMGLPLYELRETLKRAGLDWP